MYDAGSTSSTHSFITAGFTSERVDAFSCNDWNHNESCDRIGPPPAEQSIEQ